MRVVVGKQQVVVVDIIEYPPFHLKTMDVVVTFLPFLSHYNMDKQEVDESYDLTKTGKSVHEPQFTLQGIEIEIIGNCGGGNNWHDDSIGSDSGWSVVVVGGGMSMMT